MTVRPIDSLAELERVASVISAQFPPRRSGVSRGLRELEARFAEDRALMLVAELAGEIVGGALAVRDAGAVKIDVIALKPALRGRGVGRRLMREIEDAARRLGAREIYLGGANAENRGFYHRLGYAGRRSLMRKGLALR